MNLLQWFNQHAIPFTLIMAYIPLIATVVTTVISLILARATLRYTESSDRSLALAREQFERDGRRSCTLNWSDCPPATPESWLRTSRKSRS